MNLFKGKIRNLFVMMLVMGGLLNTSVVLADQQISQNTEGKVTFLPGELTLDKVSSFDFGQQPISKEDRLYGTKTKSEIQITDLRGTSEGWQLTVKATPLMTSSAQVLKGAQISFKGGKVSNSNSETVTVVDEQELIPENTVKIISASEGNGSGLSTVSWDESGVRLFVPGNSTKNATEYTASLTWTLTDSPA